MIFLHSDLPPVGRVFRRWSTMVVPLPLECQIPLLYLLHQRAIATSFSNKHHAGITFALGEPSVDASTYMR